MNRKLVILLVIVASLAMTAGIAKAAGMATDWLRVGTQASGGVTYFNGTIINETTGTGGANNPVTFGDNVRIDGRVYRGATAGTGDTLPFIVNDNMEVAGDLTVSGTLTAASVREMITGTVSSAAFVSAAETATTWTGTIYDVCTNAMRETAVTVTFTPTAATTGTWSSNPINIFRTNMVCGTAEQFPRGTYTGSYKVIDDAIFAYSVRDPNNADPGTGYAIIGTLRGDTLRFVDYQNIPHQYTILTRQ